DAVADEFQGTKIENVDLVSGLFLSGATLAHYLAAGLGDQFYAGAVAAAVSASRSRARRHSLLEIARTVPYARLIAIDLIVSAVTLRPASSAAASACAGSAPRASCRCAAHTAATKSV